MKTRINEILPTLNEYQRRIYLVSEAKNLDPGGISIVSNTTGVTRKTIQKGIKELDNPNTEPMPIGKSRKQGGGRKPANNTNSPKNIDRTPHQRRSGKPVFMDKQKPVRTSKKPERTRLHCKPPAGRYHA
jgi:hypothetical protein